MGPFNVSLCTYRQDQFTITSPGVKFLVYKDCKKNVHRVKVRTDRKNANNTKAENAYDLSVDVDDQFLKDNLNTMEKMHQLRAQLESKKRDKHTKPTRTYSLSIGGNAATNSGSAALDNEASDEVDGGMTSFARRSTLAKHSRHLYLPLPKNAMERSDGSPRRSLLGKAVKSCEAGASSTMHTHKDDTMWPTAGMAECSGAKPKSTKAAWVQNLIDMMKTSKVPLSTDEIIEIKESFDNLRDTVSRDNNKSVIGERPSVDPTSVKPQTFAAAAFKQSTSDGYRNKLRESIRRTRSFKLSHTNDLFVEENHVSVSTQLLGCISAFVH